MKFILTTVLMILFFSPGDAILPEEQALMTSLEKAGDKAFLLWKATSERKHLKVLLTLREQLHTLFKEHLSSQSLRKIASSHAKMWKQNKKNNHSYLLKTIDIFQEALLKDDDDLGYRTQKSLAYYLGEAWQSSRTKHEQTLDRIITLYEEAISISPVELSAATYQNAAFYTFEKLNLHQMNNDFRIRAIELYQKAGEKYGDNIPAEVSDPLKNLLQ